MNRIRLLFIGQRIQKTRYYLITAMISLIMLAACSERLEEAEHLNTMIGLSELQLVRQMGVPTRKYEVDHHLFLAYIKNSFDYTSYPAFGGWGGGPWGYYNNPWGSAYTNSISASSCQTTFELLQDKVISWTQRGDGC